MPLPLTTGITVVALWPILIANPSECFCLEKAKSESIPYVTEGALYISKRSSEVTEDQLGPLRATRTHSDLRARVNKGLASRSVITIGCSILAVSIPSVRKVKSSALSCKSQL